MNKSIVVIIVAIALTGCGAKKRTASRRAKPITSVEKKEVITKASEEVEGTVYVLPEDTGKFVKFKINSVEEYIDTFAEIAQFEMKAYGIPASITLAQGILESGAGRGALTAKTNNHFGIKCHTGWQGDYDFHDDDEKGECFRKYNHPMYSFRDHSIFLSSRSRYNFLFDYRNDDYKSWARGLSKAGYATDKKYPQKLIAFIERYKLYRYDRAVVDEGYVVEEQVANPDLKTHIVEKGDTLYSISKRYYVTVDHIMRLNKMNSTRLSIGQELIIKSEKLN